MHMAHRVIFVSMMLIVVLSGFLEISLPVLILVAIFTTFLDLFSVIFGSAMLYCLSVNLYLLYLLFVSNKLEALFEKNAITLDLLARTIWIALSVFVILALLEGGLPSAERYKSLLFPIFLFLLIENLIHGVCLLTFLPQKSREKARAFVAELREQITQKQTQEKSDT